MRKILLAVGALVVVIILAFVALSFNKDKTGPALAEVLANQRTIIDASNLATTKATGSQTQNDAANLSIVVLSHQTQTAAYYAKHVNKKLPNAGTNPVYQEVTKLENAVSGPAYDEGYLKLVKERLSANLATLKSIYDATQATALRELTTQLYQDQAALLANL